MAPKQRIMFSEINVANMKDFYDEILELKTDDISTIDAIMHYCESKNLDVEDVIPIIPDSIKAMIESEEIVKRNIKPTKEFHLGSNFL